jgi:hypothetical protein
MLWIWVQIGMLKVWNLDRVLGLVHQVWPSVEVHDKSDKRSSQVRRKVQAL